MTALACQRHLFDMPREVAYLDAAAYGPLPLAVNEAGIAGVATKRTPWLHDRTLACRQAERARTLAAGLIGATADDIAIVGSISQAIAVAARNLPLPAGSRVLRVANEFPSQSLEWSRIAEASGATVDVVATPADGDWTSAVVAAIERPDAPPLAIAALTPLHWTDGARIDLDRIAPAVHRAGAALVIDATQAVGAMPLDARALGADFLAFPTYKWVLGPYSLAFLYAAPHRQGGEPLDRNGFNGVGATPAVGARRYDMGECLNPVAIPMALAGLELVSAWTPSAIADRLRTLTDHLADGLAACGHQVAPAERRVPHILGLRLPEGVPAGLIAQLAARGVHVSDRSGAVRISPHVYNDAADIDRCIAAVRAI